MEAPQKVKNITTTWSSSFTTEYISKENENINLKTYIYPNVHSNLIYISWDMETD